MGQILVIDTIRLPYASIEASFHQFKDCVQRGIRNRSQPSSDIRQKLEDPSNELILIANNGAQGQFLVEAIPQRYRDRVVITDMRAELIPIQRQHYDKLGVLHFASKWTIQEYIQEQFPSMWRKHKRAKA